MFQPRGRSGSKLTIVYDADGREIEVHRSLVTVLVVVEVVGVEIVVVVLVIGR